ALPRLTSINTVTIGGGGTGSARSGILTLSLTTEIYVQSTGATSKSSPGGSASGSTSTTSGSS
ncbi:MAG: hypothetical protein ACRD6W_08615, partial [Nitrososphaerales archaeon]